MQSMKGCKCLVEVLDEDGNDNSEAPIAILRSLGAAVSRVMDDNLTHYVCANASMRRMLAAKLLNISVVSPLWIDKCRELNTRVEEGDYQYTSDLIKIISSIDGKGGEVELTNSLLSLQTPHLSIKRNSSINVNHNDDNIATPSFRLYEPPVVQDDGLKRRRSERLIEKASSDDDDDGNDDEEYIFDIDVFGDEEDGASGKGKGGGSNLGWDMGRRKEVSAEAELPVRYRSRPTAASRTLRTFAESLAVETASDTERRRLRAVHSGPSGRRSSGISRATSSATLHQPVGYNNDDDYNEDEEAEEDGEEVIMVAKRPVGRPRKHGSISSSSPSLQKKKKMTSVNGTTGRARGRPRLNTPVQAKGRGRGRPPRSASSTASASASRHKSAAEVEEEGDDEEEQEAEEKGLQGQAVRRPSKMVVTVTGFDPVDGERDTMLRTLLGIQAKSPMGRFSDDPDEHEILVEVVQSQEDDRFPLHPEQGVTHLVVSNRCDKRTLQILFALASGALIVAEEWVFDCLCAGQWVAVEQRHLLSRYAPLPASLDAGQRIQEMAVVLPWSSPRLFKGRTYCLLRSMKPDGQTLRRLITMAGGSVLTDPVQVSLSSSAASTLAGFIVGDHDDLHPWFHLLRRKKQARELRAVSAVGELIAGGVPLLTARYFANCLEERQVRYALRADGEALGSEDYNLINENVRAELKELFPRSPAPGTRPSTSFSSSSDTKLKSNAKDVDSSKMNSKKTVAGSMPFPSSIPTATMNNSHSGNGNGNSNSSRHAIRSANGKFLSRSAALSDPFRAVIADAPAGVVEEVVLLSPSPSPSQHTNGSRMEIDQDQDRDGKEGGSGGGGEKENRMKAAAMAMATSIAAAPAAFSSSASSRGHHHHQYQPSPQQPENGNGGGMFGILSQLFLGSGRKSSVPQPSTEPRSVSRYNEDMEQLASMAGPDTQMAASSMLLLSSSKGNGSSGNNSGNGSSGNGHSSKQRRLGSGVVGLKALGDDYDDLAASPSPNMDKKANGRLKRKLSSSR